MEPVPSSPRLHSHCSGAGGKGWASTGDMSTRMQQLLGTAHTRTNTHTDTIPHNSCSGATHSTQQLPRNTHKQQLLGNHTHTEATASQD